MENSGFETADDLLSLEVPGFDNIVSQCKYYTFPSDTPETNNEFSLIHINARSMKSKFDDIQNLLAVTGVDWSAICISETWMKYNQLDYFALDGYDLYASCRESAEGGGTLIYIYKKAL